MGLLFSVNLIRLLTAQSALLPRKLSFKHTLQLWLTGANNKSPLLVLKQVKRYSLF